MAARIVWSGAGRVRERGTALSAFWPRRGPVWDGLGRTARGNLLLVEAKAHIGEMVSPASQANRHGVSDRRAE